MHLAKFKIFYVYLTESTTALDEKALYFVFRHTRPHQQRQFLAYKHKRKGGIDGINNTTFIPLTIYIVCKKNTEPFKFKLTITCCNNLTALTALVGKAQCLIHMGNQ